MSEWAEIKYPSRGAVLIRLGNIAKITLRGLQLQAGWQQDVEAIVAFVGGETMTLDQAEWRQLKDAINRDALINAPPKKPHYLDKECKSEYEKVSPVAREPVSYKTTSLGVELPTEKRTKQDGKLRGSGAISGLYNARDAQNRLVQHTARSPAELMRMCLDAIGEYDASVDPAIHYGISERDIKNNSVQHDKLGNGSEWHNPLRDWDAVNPAKALAELCEHFCCDIKVKDNRVYIEQRKITLRGTPEKVDEPVFGFYHRAFDPKTKRMTLVKDEPVAATQPAGQEKKSDETFGEGRSKARRAEFLDRYGKQCVSYTVRTMSDDSLVRWYEYGAQKGVTADGKVVDYEPKRTCQLGGTYGLWEFSPTPPVPCNDLKLIGSGVDKAAEGGDRTVAIKATWVGNLDEPSRMQVTYGDFTVESESAKEPEEVSGASSDDAQPPAVYCESCGGWDKHKIGCKAASDV